MIFGGFLMVGTSSNGTFRWAISVLFLVMMLLLLLINGISPETVLAVTLLWILSAVLFRAWEYGSGKLDLTTLLHNVVLYGTLMVLVGVEYLFLRESLHGISKEMVMFFTVWALSGIFEFVWPGFRT